MLQRISSSSAAICQNLGSVFAVLFCCEPCDAWRSKTWMIFNLAEAKYQLYRLDMLRFETATHGPRSKKNNNMYKHISCTPNLHNCINAKPLPKLPTQTSHLSCPTVSFGFDVFSWRNRRCDHVEHSDRLFWGWTMSRQKHFFRLDTNVEECDMIGYLQWFWKKVRMASYFATWEIGHWKWVS